MVRCGMDTPRPRNLLSIQYLRGLAALVVVLLHLDWRPFFPGHAGVDVFFVISGFIMMHTSRREPAPGSFLAARARRVLPLWWLAVLLTAVQTTDNAPWRVLAALVLWPTLRWDGEWQFIVGPGWTLVYEALFYLVFAACLLLPARHRLPAMTASLLLVCAATALAAPAVLTTFGISPMLLPEFLGGAWLYRAWQEDKLPGAAAGYAMVLGGASAILLQPGIAGDLLWRPIGLGIPALLVVAGGLTIERRGRLPRVPVLALLGDASYALYLTHVITLGLLRKPLAALPGVLAFPVVLTACIAVALMVHRWVEQPAARWLDPNLRRGGVAGASGSRTGAGD